MSAEEEFDYYECGSMQAKAMDEYGDGVGQALFKADDHKYGKGKIHCLLVEDPARTRCGKPLVGTAGSLVTGTTEHITCRGCLSGLDSDKRQLEWQEQSEQRQREREAQNAEWWRWYTEYLDSREWAERRQAVLKRARYVCEGCGAQRAVQVHHLTYARAGQEMLFDLVAVCLECHENLHEGRWQQ